MWDGYSYSDGIHPDQKLLLLGFQGLSGRVLQGKRTQFADLRRLKLNQLKWHQRWLMMNDFRLTCWQLKRTEHLLYVLSVPSCVWFVAGEVRP